MPHPHDAPGSADEENQALERALSEVPRGAVALAGTAVILLMIGWLGLYLLEFLPRGSVG